MKRRLLLTCTLATSAFLLAGCSAQNTDASKTDSADQTEISADAEGDQTDADAKDEQTAAEADTDASSDDTAAEPKKITPVTDGIDMENLNDCTIPVSFSQEDVTAGEDGSIQLTFEVYTYDSYDMVDISQLAVGDQITICQEDITVTSLERSEEGRPTIDINGGMSAEGGYTLTSDGDTTYYALDTDDSKIYYSIGSTTLPVSSDCQFDDSSDPSSATPSSYTADVLLNVDASIYDSSFNPYNTAFTLMDGAVIHIERTYHP